MKISELKLQAPILKRGQSLVELLLAIGLAAILMPALITGLYASRSGKAQEQQRLQGITLLKETEESVRNVRESGWSNFSTNGTFHPEILGSVWVLSSGAETINGFTRQVVISGIMRNSSGNIVSSGGTIDPSTKLATITVSWTDPFVTSIQSEIYLTRYLDNAIWTQTTQADFNAGTKSGVTVTNSSGGEVILGVGGTGDWCAPQPVIGVLDLPKNGVANAISAIEGKAFAGTGDNASGVSFADVLISNNQNPTVTIDGTFDGYKTNGIFGENNYAYVATDTNVKEVVIIDLTSKDANGKYSEVGYFNSDGSTDANSVYVVGNTGYMTAGSKFHNFDLTSKTGSRPAIDADGIMLAGTGSRVMVVGNYAYIAIGGSPIKMQIIDLSNPTSLSVVVSLSLSTQDATDVYVNPSGTRAYLATGNSATLPEFHIVDVSNKQVVLPVIGTYDSSGMSPKGVTLATNNKAILVGTGGTEYQVIDIANENNPTSCGSMNVDTGVNGVAAVLESDGDAYSYIITGDATTEFKLIRGGPGGGYSANGIFESNTFDPGFQTAFNRLDVTYSKPSQTDIKFQVAAADAVAGSCSGVTWNFIGPDKTVNTYFTDDTGIPLDDDDSDYENPGRCFRYKAFFSTTDASQTPVLYDVTINYSP